jgi:hypothetical protein
MIEVRFLPWHQINKYKWEFVMGKIVSATVGKAGSNKDRQPDVAKWGDNSVARPTTKAYRDKYDAIFRKKDK